MVAFKTLCSHSNELFSIVLQFQPSLPALPSESNGTDLMRCIEGIQNDDIIGIAMQQSGKLTFLVVFAICPFPKFLHYQ